MLTIPLKDLHIVHRLGDAIQRSMKYNLQTIKGPQLLIPVYNPIICWLISMSEAVKNAIMSTSY